MQPPRPATIASLRRLGVVNADIYCNAVGCGHSGSVSFDRLGVTDETPFPSLARRRFICARCGGRDVSVRPDWSSYRPKGT